MIKKSNNQYMDFNLIEEQIKLKKKERLASLKSDSSVDDTVEENLEKEYRIKPILDGSFLFYYDKKKDRALVAKLELHHLMNKDIFTECLPKRWDTGKKTSKKQREKIANRIEAYYIKHFKKVVFQQNK